MVRWLIILLLPIADAAVFLVGPFLAIGPSRPLAAESIRVLFLGLTLLAAAALALGAIRRRRNREEKTQLSARAAFLATWRMVGLLSAPIAILSGLSIWVIENAYRDISDLTAEMNATLDDLRQLDPELAFADLASTAEVLTRVHRFTRRDESAMNLPLLDPETDRAYLVDHYELMVSNHLRPHLMQRLEAQITSNLGKPDALYAALKVYLMGEYISEKASVHNMSVEGMMLSGAFAGAVGSWLTGSPMLGLLFGLVAVIPVALLQALLTNVMRANQIVTGIGINILVLGASTLGYRLPFGSRSREVIPGWDKWEPWPLTPLSIPEQNWPVDRWNSPHRLGSGGRPGACART